MRVLTWRFALLRVIWWGAMVKRWRADADFAMRRMGRALADAERRRPPK